jgi:redox-sensitive bicupin YhaK (pirin superfamily)
MNQDAFLYAGLFDGDGRASVELAAGRKGYVHVARGSVSVNGERLKAGDALKTGAERIEISRGDGAEVLVFDLP